MKEWHRLQSVMTYMNKNNDSGLFSQLYAQSIDEADTENSPFASVSILALPSSYSIQQTCCIRGASLSATIQTHSPPSRALKCRPINGILAPDITVSISGAAVSHYEAVSRG